MSIKLMSQVWELDLPPGQKYVLLCLSDHANDEGAHVYPSVALIAAKCGLSERSVQSAIRVLRSNGVLEVVKKGGGRGNPTEYRVNLKGVRFAPFFSERVKSEVGKGANPVVKGAAVAPESSEPSSTEPSGAPSSRTSKSLMEDLSSIASAALPDPDVGESAPVESAAAETPLPVSSAPEADSPTPQWNVVEESCFENLRELDPVWQSLPWSGLKKLAGEFGHVILSYALQRAWETRARPREAFPYLRRMCQTIAHEIVAEGGVKTLGKEEPPPSATPDGRAA